MILLFCSNEKYNVVSRSAFGDFLLFYHAFFLIFKYMMLRKKLLFFIFFVSALVHAAPVITIDGSSTVFPISEMVSAKFRNLKNDSVTVSVKISGTSGGFKKFCRGEIDVQNASRPILKDEIDSCKKMGINYYEIPVAYGAIVIVVNKKNSWLKEVTVEDLHKIWAPASQAIVLNWKDLNVKYPDKKLKLYGAGSDSGTFDYFTEVVNKVKRSSRGDYFASEDDQLLVNSVQSEEGALGYIPLSYYLSNKNRLHVVPVVNHLGKAVIPSSSTIHDGSYTPFSRPLFIYINEKAFERPEIKEFVEFYLKNINSVAEEAGYMAFPPKIYVQLLKNIRNRRVGTLFNGENAIGLKIENLFKIENLK